MTSMRSIGRVAAACLLPLVVGCSDAEPVFTTGPIPVQGAGQMKRFLTGARQWRLSDDDQPVQLWQFDRNGTFSAWIECESDEDLRRLFSAGIPADAKKLTGKWRVTTTELQLRNIVTFSGEAVEPFTLELTWVDGKLRIEIGGHHYMRVVQ